MDFTVVDPGWNWTLTLTLVGVTALCFVGFIVLAIVGDTTRYGGVVALAVVTGVITMVVGVAALVGTVVGPATAWDSNVTGQKITAIQEFGFSEVELVGTQITARAEDGSYFKGVLVETGDLSYRIVPL